MKSVVLFVVFGVVAYQLAYWWLGYRGLNQWPNPHGRYYDEWLAGPDSIGDYYEWLAQRMGNREPWRTWAAREREMSRSRDNADREDDTDDEAGQGGVSDRWRAQ